MVSNTTDEGSIPSSPAFYMKTIISEQEIKDFLKAYQDATNSHVFLNVFEMIHPRALYRFTDGDFSGIKDIEKAFEDNWKTIQDEMYLISDIEIIHTDVNSASVGYAFKWAGLVDNEQEAGKGKGTNIIVRNGDKLHFIYEHLSR